MTATNGNAATVTTVIWRYTSTGLSFSSAGSEIRMKVERGLYARLRNGVVGLVVATGVLRSAEGNSIAFREDEVEGVADWDDISRYKQAAWPMRSSASTKSSARAAPHSIAKREVPGDSESVAKATVYSMSGPEFERYVADVLRENGYRVTETAQTGDQGADLIAERSGRRIVIQVKRYTDRVSNRAVQEVVAAVGYYKGTEAAVVTSSSFTQSARDLARAQKIRISLIEGNHLDSLKCL